MEGMVQGRDVICFAFKGLLLGKWRDQEEVTARLR